MGLVNRSMATRQSADQLSLVVKRGPPCVVGRLQLAPTSYPAPVGSNLVRDACAGGHTMLRSITSIERKPRSPTQWRLGRSRAGSVPSHPT